MNLNRRRTLFHEKRHSNLYRMFAWVLLILAAFYGVVDLLGMRRWTIPMVVVGMNSITMYCMAELSVGWFARTLKTHFGENISTFAGKTYEPFWMHVWVLLAMWLVCYWLYRQKIFIRI